MPNQQNSTTERPPKNSKDVPQHYDHMSFLQYEEEINNWRDFTDLKNEAQVPYIISVGLFFAPRAKRTAKKGLRDATTAATWKAKEGNPVSAFFKYMKTKLKSGDYRPTQDTSHALLRASRLSSESKSEFVQRFQDLMDAAEVQGCEIAGASDGVINDLLIHGLKLTVGENGLLQAKCNPETEDFSAVCAAVETLFGTSTPAGTAAAAVVEENDATAEDAENEWGFPAFTEGEEDWNGEEDEMSGMMNAFAAFWFGNKGKGKKGKGKGQFQKGGYKGQGGKGFGKSGKGGYNSGKSGKGFGKSQGGWHGNWYGNGWNFNNYNNYNGWQNGFLAEEEPWIDEEANMDGAGVGAAGMAEE